MKEKRIVYLLCSPGFGLVDIWLPVIYELKKYNICIYFIFPESSTLAVVEKESQLFEISEFFLDGVIFKNHSNMWMFGKNLCISKTISTVGKVDGLIMKFTSRLIAGKLSAIYGVPAFGRLIRQLLAVKEKAKCRIKYGKGIFVKNLDMFGTVSAILYDVTSEFKPVNKSFLEYFELTPKYSMFHGPASRWFINNRKNKKSHFIEGRKNTVVYTHSLYENLGYQENYNIGSNNIITTGIVRHDKDWINFIMNYKIADNKKLAFDDFVLLISRPASPYNPVDRKKRYIKDINDLICKKLNQKIVIKLHPKEDIHGTDGKIFSEIFGKDNYGKTWCYSSLHPIVLGSKCRFGISFFSTVATDLIALGKPTIEYLDLRGLPAYDNNDALRDDEGHPVFSERYAKLVLGASDYNQFEDHVYKVIKEYDKVVGFLRGVYNNYYPLDNNILKKVSSDINQQVSNH
jgi:hypothetical protein